MITLRYFTTLICPNLVNEKRKLEIENRILKQQIQVCESTIQILKRELQSTRLIENTIEESVDEEWCI